ncbi:MAG: hypothetical protein R3D05_01820 [Dongiaceae bacterium]
MRHLSRHETRQLLRAIRAYRVAHPKAPPLAITCAGRRDGAGAQALGVLSTMLVARKMRLRYLHTPFSMMGHAPGSREDWAKAWEAFLNLGFGEEPVPPGADLVHVKEFLRDGIGVIRPDTVLAAPAYHWRKFQTPGALRRSGMSLRAKYRASRSPRPVVHRAPPGALTVAVHIRRGDVSYTHPIRKFFYTFDPPILKTIEGVRAVAARLGRETQVNVFSEGPPEMFSAYAAAGCRLHLGGDAFEAFHNLVSADILVQAKSSFSYIAGLISTGAVVHEPYSGQTGKLFYRSAPGWIVREESGAFDPDELRTALIGETWYRRTLQRILRWF